MGEGRFLARAASCLLLGTILAACGGEQGNGFANAVYIQINNGSSLKPVSLVAPIGYRIVFLNNENVRHTITWEAPLSLSAIAEANDRAWFDLPPVPPGSVLHYHLDSSGPTGSVTLLQAPPTR